MSEQQVQHLEHIAIQFYTDLKRKVLIVALTKIELYNTSIIFKNR